MTGPFTIAGALRYDWLDTTSGASSLDDGYSQSDSALTWRLGVSYALNETTNAFANMSTSFAPNVQRIYADPSDYVGTPGVPTEARQNEIGLKFRTLDEDLQITATLFDIHQNNGMIVETMSDGRNTGRQYDLTSQGAELEAAMNLGNGFSMIGAYTYTRVKINEGPAGQEDQDLWGVPRNMLSLFGKYEVQQGGLEGLALMAGMRAMGSSHAAQATTPDNAGRAYFDLGVSYDFARFGYEGTMAQLNIRNLFDRREQICTNWCYADEPRFITFSLAHRF